MAIQLPNIPVKIPEFIQYVERQAKSQQDVRKLAEPFKAYEDKLRLVFAQEPHHPAVKDEHLVSVFDSPAMLTIRARDVDSETTKEKEGFILPLTESQRKKSHALATVQSTKEFRNNFNIFSESSLVDLDWSNVVAAGSSVLTALLPVDSDHKKSKRDLRAYYHEKLAPASDVDLFIYGLDAEAAKEKIRTIERCVRDSILAETTTIRTKNAITIVSEYPTRHVQIVLRLYKSISEILTGFDVDCSCVAFDGENVLASPRALVALSTQVNSIDLTRRSPSYENRLSKYSHRGFEVGWPELDRSKVDPTIYERSFSRVQGLARLLVLEKLPHPSDRDSFLAKRRLERGRPDLPWNARYRHALPGNVKDSQPDDVAEWVEEDQHSSYHTFTIPYGPRYTAAKIEKLLFKKDLLLNAEWNKSKDREANLHRHPAFFGALEDVFEDCCGSCPTPTTDADLAVQEAESKLYVSGKLQFIEDNPGRQAVGSFNPITDEDWTDMAYVGNTSQLCRAIVDDDLNAVLDWFSAGGNVNHRDHTGRTPLQLAVMTSSPDVVQCLVDRGARITSRIYNGMTALHMAAHRGDTKIVKILLEKSALNEEEENKKEDIRKKTRRANAEADSHADKQQATGPDVVDAEDADSDHDFESIDEGASDASSVAAKTEGSFVKVETKEQHIDTEDDLEEPDFYNVDVLAWDNPVSPLHLAILFGRVSVVKELVDTYGADAMLPVKLMTDYTPRQPRGTIMTPVLAGQLGLPNTVATTAAVLQHGGSLAQADTNGASAFHYLAREAKPDLLDELQQNHMDTVDSLINHLILQRAGYYLNKDAASPLTLAIKSQTVLFIRKLISMGARTEIDFESFATASDITMDPDEMRKTYLRSVDQPVIQASQRAELADIVDDLIDAGVDVNTMSAGAHNKVIAHGGHGQECYTLLDSVRERMEALRRLIAGNPSQPKLCKPGDLKQEENPAGNTSGPYETWVLQKNRAAAEENHALQKQKYDEEVIELEKRNLETDEKLQRARDLLEKWTQIEKKMLEKGAKEFDELHPGLHTKNTYWGHTNNWYGPTPNTDPWTNRISFIISDLTDAKKVDYLSLFEAAFVGDTEKVEDLCLGKHDGKAPLQIAVQDTAGFSPFSIAVVRGHEKLALKILDIAAAQYQPSKEDEKEYRYSLRRPDEWEDSDVDSDASSEDGSDADSLQIYRELVSHKFTIDDVRSLSGEVRSKVSPQMMLDWRCEVWRLDDAHDAALAKESLYFNHSQRRVQRQRHGPEGVGSWAWFNGALQSDTMVFRDSLYRHAIVQNDSKMLKFLIHIHKQLNYDANNALGLQKLQLAQDDVDCAMSLGRTEMLSEMIRQIGIMLPLQRLAEKAGVHVEENAKYYQGLTVHGRKRSDWAEADRGSPTLSVTPDGSPLLRAIFAGNLAAVEYFLSDTPLRHYEYFIETVKDDPSIEKLRKSEGGVERSLQSWMNTRVELAFHMAVMADPATSQPVLEYLIRKLPQYLNSKCRSGWTPLLTAFHLGRYDAARMLVAAGANQMCRDGQGRNVLHVLYQRQNDLRDGLLKDATSVLSPDKLPLLAVQRASVDMYGFRNHRTPLAELFAIVGPDAPESESMLDMMLNLSEAKDLQVMNEAGEYILHQLVRVKKDKMIRYMVNKVPEMLYWENATGMTPIEVAETAFLADLMQNPPNFGHRYYSSNSPSLDGVSLKDTRKIEVYDEKSRILRLLYELDDKHSTGSTMPRKLVSLLDANEVARRLAEEQARANKDLKEREARGRKVGRSWRPYRDRHAAEQQDEVSHWLRDAEKFINKKPTTLSDQDLVIQSNRQAQEMLKARRALRANDPSSFVILP